MRRWGAREVRPDLRTDGAGDDAGGDVGSPGSSGLPLVASLLSVVSSVSVVAQQIEPCLVQLQMGALREEEACSPLVLEPAALGCPEDG